MTKSADLHNFISFYIP